jgi:hypothetical protein
MRLDFTARGFPGSVEVTVEPNVDPPALGSPAHAKDFPVCRATVTHGGAGYASAFGWIQLVRSTDGAAGGERFELDPYEPLGSLPHPFCWFGFAPTLFDAPARESRAPLDWTAHSFLCLLAGEAKESEIQAVLGFSWGFSIRGERISLTPPAPQSEAEWDRHAELLAGDFPAWRFATGYRLS